MLFLFFSPPLSSLLNSEVPAGVWVFCSTWAWSVSLAGVSLLRKQILPFRELRWIRRLLGVFLLTYCFHLRSDQHRCICWGLEMSPMGCLIKPCGGKQQEQTDSFWNTLIFLPYTTKRKEMSRAESPNLYSDCIITVQGSLGICVKIKGNCRCEPNPRRWSYRKVTLYSHCNCNYVFPKTSLHEATWTKVTKH